MIEGLGGGVVFSGWSFSVVVIVLGVASVVEVDVRFKNHATRRDSGIGTEPGAEVGGGKVRSGSTRPSPLSRGP